MTGTEAGAAAGAAPDDVPVRAGGPPPGDGVAPWQVRRHRPGWRPLPVVGVAVVVTLIAAGLFLLAGRDSPTGGGTAVAAPTSAVTSAGGPPVTSAGRPPATAQPVAPPPQSRPAATGPPTRVRIPRIGVDSGLEQLRLDGRGELRPPVDYGRAGWYADGTVPGDTGPAVIAGHVNSYHGPGVFARLSELRPGDEVEVNRGSGVVRFRVVQVERYPKNRFPTGRVYGPTPDAELRLITCGGPFDERARSYLDNVVAYAITA